MKNEKYRNLHLDRGDLGSAAKLCEKQNRQLRGSYPREQASLPARGQCRNIFGAPIAAPVSPLATQLQSPDAVPVASWSGPSETRRRRRKTRACLFDFECPADTQVRQQHTTATRKRYVVPTSPRHPAGAARRFSSSPPAFGAQWREHRTRARSLTKHCKWTLNER